MAESRTQAQLVRLQSPRCTTRKGTWTQGGSSQKQTPQGKWRCRHHHTACCFSDVYFFMPVSFFNSASLVHIVTWMYAINIFWFCIFVSIKYIIIIYGSISSKKINELSLWTFIIPLRFVETYFLPLLESKLFSIYYFSKITQSCSLEFTKFNLPFRSSCHNQTSPNTESCHHIFFFRFLLFLNSWSCPYSEQGYKIHMTTQIDISGC